MHEIDMLVRQDELSASCGIRRVAAVNVENRDPIERPLVGDAPLLLSNSDD
jgi:hypothetical protein